MRIRVARDLGGEQWFDEILSMVLARDKLKQVERDIATDKGFLDKAALKSIRSMSGAAASVMAAAKLAQENIGSGFDKAFTQVAEAILRHVDTFNFDSIRDHFEALTDGILQGFGLKDWGQAVDWLASQFSSGTIESWRAWGRGLTSGIKAWAGSLMSAFNVVNRLTGAGSNPESIGKLAATFTVLASSLIIINPLLLIFAATIASLSGLRRLSSLLKSPLGKSPPPVVGANPVVATAALAWLLAENNDTGVSDSAIKRRGETTSQWRERQRKLKELRNYKTPSSADPLFQPSSYLGEKLDKLGGKIERAGLLSTDISAMRRGDGISYAHEGGASGGGGGGKGRMISGVGTPEALWKHVTPGAVLPNFGVGAGGIIKRPSLSATGDASLNIPSGGVGDMSVGRSVGSSAVLASDRARFREELDRNPELKKRLAAVIDLENPGAGTAVAESLFNRMSMNGGTVASGIGGGSRSFYGPVRRGLVEPRLRELERNPAKMAARMRQIDEALAGSNYVQGHTDQGSAGDPNYIAGGTGVNINRERFNDWGGGRWHGKTGHAASRAYREDLMRRIQESTGPSITSRMPTPADVIKSVPQSNGTITNSLLQRNNSAILGNGRSGSATININGNSHDPEALANLVQRRVDESMNWRVHDSESEYT